jgi:hypothetical protein
LNSAAVNRQPLSVTIAGVAFVYSKACRITSRTSVAVIVVSPTVHHLTIVRIEPPALRNTSRRNP